jgi:hypothetical protein
VSSIGVSLCDQHRTMSVSRPYRPEDLEIVGIIEYEQPRVLSL